MEDTNDWIVASLFLYSVCFAIVLVGGMILRYNESRTARRAFVVSDVLVVIGCAVLPVFNVYMTMTIIRYDTFPVVWKLLKKFGDIVIIDKP